MPTVRYMEQWHLCRVWCKSALNHLFLMPTATGSSSHGGHVGCLSPEDAGGDQVVFQMHFIAPALIQ